MAATKTASVNVRIDQTIKIQAEAILEKSMVFRLRKMEACGFGRIIGMIFSILPLTMKANTKCFQSC